MTDTETADPIAALAEQVAALTAAVERIGGYAAQEEWTWVECDSSEDPWVPLAPREGAEPLRIECRCDLLIAETEAIPVHPDALLRDLWRAIAPHIRAWNVRTLDAETGEWWDVLPPRAMGPDAFKYAKPLAAQWMGFVLKFATMRQNNLPKGSPPSAGTPNSPSAPASASSSPAKPSRRNRKGST